MTLQEWCNTWPYRPIFWFGNRASHLEAFGDAQVISIPDCALMEKHRMQCYLLDDYRVSSISGGSIWFRKIIP